MINLNVHPVELVCEEVRRRIVGKNLKMSSDVNPLKLLSDSSPVMIDYQGTIWIEIDVADGGASAVGINGFHHVPCPRSRWVISISKINHVRLWAFSGTNPRGSYDLSDVTLSSITAAIDAATDLKDGNNDKPKKLRNLRPTL